MYFINFSTKCWYKFNILQYPIRIWFPIFVQLSYLFVMQMLPRSPITGPSPIRCYPVGVSMSPNIWNNHAHHEQQTSHTCELLLLLLLPPSPSIQTVSNKSTIYPFRADLIPEITLSPTVVYTRDVSTFGGVTGGTFVDCHHYGWWATQQKKYTRLTCMHYQTPTLIRFFFFHTRTQTIHIDSKPIQSVSLLETIFTMSRRPM